MRGVRGVRAFVGHLAASGCAGFEDAQHAAEECWVLTSPAVYAQLTTVRGWDAAAYRDWLARMLAAVVLPPAAEPSR